MSDSEKAPLPEYNIHPVDLGDKVEGCVTPNDDGAYDIYVNSRHWPESQRRTTEHELRHLMLDHFRLAAMIGVLNAEREAELRGIPVPPRLTPEEEEQQWYERSFPGSREIQGPRPQQEELPPGPFGIRGLAAAVDGTGSVDPDYPYKKQLRQVTRQSVSPLRAQSPKAFYKIYATPQEARKAILGEDK